MQKQTKMTMKKFLLRFLVVFGITGVVCTGVAFAAAGTSAVTLSSLSTNIGGSIKSLAKIMTDVSLVAGIGFVMASFFKFHQHKLNPNQVPMSQGITLLLIGAGLTMFPLLLPTATDAVFGKTSLATDSDMTGLLTGISGSATK